MLALQTTNSSWEPTQVGEASRLYYKLLSLEHLAVYWRSKASKQFCKMSPSELLENFIKGIACDNSRPYDDCYVAGPISLQAKMMFNSRPELDGSNFSIPKIFLKLTLEEISMGLSPDQYQDIIDCLNNMERMSRAAPYRKHRPLVFTNSRTRWRFAKECVLEEVVRRRRKNWNWSHMKEHRDKVKQYVTLYKKKLLSKKEEPLLKKSLEGYEDRLDVFNITLARRQAEVEVFIIHSAFKDLSYICCFKYRLSVFVRSRRKSKRPKRKSREAGSVGFVVGHHQSTPLNQTV